MKDSSQDRFTPLSLTTGMQIYVVQRAYFSPVFQIFLTIEGNFENVSPRKTWSVTTQQQFFLVLTKGLAKYN